MSNLPVCAKYANRAQRNQQPCCTCRLLEGGTCCKCGQGGTLVINYSVPAPLAAPSDPDGNLVPPPDFED